MISAQIFDMLDVGLVILDRELKVQHWNRWMAIHSSIDSEEIQGSSLFDFFPHLKNQKFLRNIKSVLTFGNLCFLSQKLHKYLFPFEPVGSLSAHLDHMQQSCTIGPIRDENNAIQSLFISVQDVSHVVVYEHRLMELNLRDPLTGAFNRRFLESQLKREFDRHARHRRPLCVVMLDIDFFKKVNDTYGHQCGDTVLARVAATVAKSVRSSDYLARYGGEEFCCLLPECDLEGGRTLAERLRKAVENSETLFEDTLVKVTISLGVAAVRASTEHHEELLKEADDALYEAKRSGRNRVVTADGIANTR